MTYIFKEDIKKEEYDDFITKHKMCNLLQSYDWANIKDNWQHMHVGVYDSNRLAAVALILIKQLPLNFTMFYIPKGPVMDYQNLELIKYFFDNLKKIAKKRHCLFIKLDPAILKNTYKIENQNTNISDEAKEAIFNLKQAGCHHLGFTMNIDETIQPRFHAVVEVDQDYEENLPKHTKKLMNVAKKKNVLIETTGIDGIEEFSRVINKTENRKGISLRNKEYFAKLMNTYKDDAVIILAKLNLKDSYNTALTKLKDVRSEIESCPSHAVKKLRDLKEKEVSYSSEVDLFKKYLEIDGDTVTIAGALTVCYGKTSEMLYAGMDETYKKFMAQYYIYVETMKWINEHGCTMCNLGGIEGSLNDGLTKFKANFNPIIYEYIGEFEYPVSHLYRLAKIAYNWRKKH